MIRPQFRPIHLAAVGAIALVASLTGSVRTLNDPQTERDNFLFNSDFFYPAELYRDVIVDGRPVDEFQFSASTFAVPDVAGYFVVRAAVGSPARAMVPWAAALAALVGLAAWAAGSAMLPGDARRWLPGVLLCGAAVYLADASLRFFHTDAVELLRPLSHNGALAGTLLGLALTVGYFRAGSISGKIARLLGIGITSAAMMASDRWFGLWFAAPLGVSLAGLRLLVPPARGGPTLGRSVAVLAAVAVGGMIGLRALGLALGPQEDAVHRYWKGPPEAFRLVARAEVLAGRAADQVAAGDLLVIAGVGWWAVAGGAVLAAGFRRLTGRGPVVGPWLLLYCLVTLAAVAFTLAVFLATELAAVLDRPHLWNEYGRYFLGPLGLGLFGWAIALAALAPSRRRAVRATATGLPAVAALGLSLAALLAPRQPAEDVFDYYPADVRVIDSACAGHGVRRGLGGYWDAKRVTFLSRGGVEILQVVDTEGTPLQMTAHYWLNNPRAYWEGPGGYGFILARIDNAVRLGPREPVVRAVFGDPAAAVPVSRTGVLMVYGRPGDDRLARFADLDPTVRAMREAK